MSFGYSVGDVLAGANMTYRLVKIMTDSQGACMEYQEAISELSLMQQALMQVNQIKQQKILPAATVNAAAHIVMESVDIIAKFLERTKMYQQQLSDPKSNNFRASWYRIGWQLYGKEELRDLRDCLKSRLSSLSLLLSASQIYIFSSGDISQHRVDGSTSHKQRTTNNAAGASNGEKISASPESQTSDTKTDYDKYLERSDLLLLNDPIGRKFELPFEMCRTWDGMRHLIREAFLRLDTIIAAAARSGWYDLIGPRDTVLLRPIWKDTVKPGWTIVMKMRSMEEYSARLRAPPLSSSSSTRSSLLLSPAAPSRPLPQIISHAISSRMLKSLQHMLINQLLKPLDSIGPSPTIGDILPVLHRLLDERVLNTSQYHEAVQGVIDGGLGEDQLSLVVAELVAVLKQLISEGDADSGRGEDEKDECDKAQAGDGGEEKEGNTTILLEHAVGPGVKLIEE